MFKVIQVPHELGTLPALVRAHEKRFAITVGDEFDDVHRVAMRDGLAAQQAFRPLFSGIRALLHRGKHFGTNIIY